MKNQILALIFITIMVVLVSGCTNGSQTYNANGVTFNYPNGWYQNIPTDTQINTSGLIIPVIAVVGDNNNDETGILVQRSNSSLSQETASKVIETDLSQSGTLITENNVTINNVSAREFVYNKTLSTGLVKKERLIIYTKNQDLYLIIFTALPSDYDSQQTNFNMVQSSFKVQ